MSLLIVRVGAADAEAAADWLWALGATAIEERPDDAELIAGFADGDQAMAVRSVIGERWPTRFETPPDESEWRDVWLRHLEPTTIGRITIHPPWKPPGGEHEHGQPPGGEHEHKQPPSGEDDKQPPRGEHEHKQPPSGDGEGELMLSIDPGRAFGSGHHESTRLAICALDAVVRPGDRVLDVGCGTGVLAVVARALGAGSVRGIDIDADIVELARSNAEANGMTSADLDTWPDALTDGASPVAFDTTPVGAVALDDDPFDVVVANMTIGTVQPLLADIVASTSRDLILSGLLHDHIDRVSAAVGAAPDQRWTEGPWVAARWQLERAS